METTEKPLTEEERRERALRLTRRMLESKREGQEEIRREAADPNSALSRGIRELKEKNDAKGHPFAV
jgi:hypothetical protein